MSEKSVFDRFGHTTVTIASIETDIYAILANFSTLSNLFLGLTISLSILFFGNPLHPLLVTRMIVLAGSFDAVDGRLARKSNMKPKLGAQFDTAADQISFATAPALMIFVKLFEFNFTYAVLIAFLYFFTGSFRLSRFMMEPTGGYFEGMPSPVSALFVAAWFTQESYSVPLFAASMVMISLTMISNLPYTAFKTVRSPAQAFYFVFTIVMMLLLTYAPNKWMGTLGKIWIVYIYYFTIVGPAHARHNMRIDKELAREAINSISKN